MNSQLPNTTSSLNTSNDSTSQDGGAASGTPSTSNGPDFGEVISTYSRAQAIDDGVLIDLSAAAPEVCRQHLNYPVACTAAVWGIIERAIANKRYCNDLNGIVHDMLWMSRKCSRTLDESTRLFVVIITGAGRQRNYTFKIVCGPGDNAEPVLTIMLPTED